MLEFINSIPLGYYVFGTILNFTISISMGTLLLIRTQHLKPNKLFAIYSYFIALWSLFYTLSLAFPSMQYSLFFLRTCMIPVCFMATLFFHFICVLIGTNKYKLFIQLNYIFSFIVVLFIYTDFFAYGYIAYPIIKHWLKGGPVLTISILHFFCMVTFTYSLLIRAINNPESKGIKKVQYIYILIGTLVGYLAGFSNYLIWYKIGPPPILNMFTSVYLITVPYAIMSYKLIDVNYIFKKIIAYFVYLCFTTFIIFTLVGMIFNIKTFKVLLFIFLILALLPFIYSHIINLIDSIILKDFKIRIKSLSDFFTQKSYDKIPTTVEGWSKYFVKKLHKITGVSRTIIFCFNRELGAYRLYAQKGAEELKDYKLEFNDVLANYLRKTKSYIVKSELNPNNEEHNKILEIMNDLEFELIFSFFAEDDLIGILGFGDRKGTNLFHKKEIDKLAYLVKAIEHSLSTVYFTQDMEELKNITKRFTEFKDRKQVNPYIGSSVMRLFNSTHVAIYLINAEKKYFSCEYQKGYEDKEILQNISEDNYFFTLLKNTEKVLCYKELKDKIGDLELEDLQEALDVMERLKASIIVPLVSSQPLGFMVVGPKRTGTAYSTNDMIMYSQLSIITAIKIHGIMIKEEAELDQLTKAHNRVSLHSWMHRFILLSKKEKKPFVVLAIDLDKFKEINDKRGHNHGNLVLKEFSSKIQDVSRPKDILFRTGGEEFLWILWDINIQDVEKVRERLLIALKKGKYTNKLTLSLGKVIFIPDREGELITSNIKSIERTIFKLGDDATYRAKQEGRNRMCDGGEIFDSHINDIYKLSIQIVSNKEEDFEDFGIYFNSNEIEVKESSWKNVMEVFEAERPDGFLCILNKKIDLDVVKQKIQDIKTRSLSSVIGVVLKDEKFKS
ncbi:diguanylate cyclase, partial [bacterium]